VLLHIVLFEPRPDLSAEATRALVASIEQAARGIPSVRRFEVGRRLEGGPTYGAAASPALSYAAIVAFDDRAGLESYLAHPAHADLGRLFHESMAAALVYDCAVRDAGASLGGWLAGDA
jgi:hypothetical protein